MISKFEKMTAKVDITDPYNSCPEAVKWDSMTLDTFIRSCVSYEVREFFSGVIIIKSDFLPNTKS